MEIRSVANLAGVSPHTVRYYVRRGLLAPKRDAKSGYHRFGERDMRTLVFNRRAQALGFTLREIEMIVEMARRRASPCPVVRDIVRRRIVEFSKQLLELDRKCSVMPRGAAPLAPRIGQHSAGRGDLPADRVGARNGLDLPAARRRSIRAPPDGWSQPPGVM